MEGYFHPSKLEELIQPHELKEPYDAKEELERAHEHLSKLDRAIAHLNGEVQDLLDAGYALNSREVTEKCDYLYALRRAWNLWDEDWSELRWEVQGWPEDVPLEDFPTSMQDCYPLDIEAIRKRTQELWGK